MQILTIKVPDSKIQLVKAFLKETGIAFKNEANIPNANTKAAMNELKAGKGKKLKSVEELFKSI